jgi:hypothetical protein
MKFKTYLDLYQLLEVDDSTKEQRRAFGLSNVLLKNKPLEQLMAWVEAHQQKLKTPRLSEIFSSYLYGISLTLLIVGFIVGFFSGVALLNYNGHAPVNVIYFMAMVIALPLLTMTLTLFSMLKAQQSRSVLIHLSPSYWMEKIVAFLPRKMQENLASLRLNPLLANWIVIKRSQSIALFFSLGLFVALLLVVSTKDIAFSWSTTLDVTAEAFHSFLHTLALPCRSWFPSAVPSLELIEQSQYFRLGDGLSEEMIQHASKLGQWWKFLAFATLFYAIFLRLLMFLLATLGWHMAVKKSFFSLAGVRNLLRDMNEPIITTSAKEDDSKEIVVKEGVLQTVQKLDASYDMVQGWAMSEEQLHVLADAMQIITPLVYDVGGTNSLEEDAEIIHKSHGEVLLYVKAWEPPTMDFMDYIEALLVQVDRVIVVPVGIKENNYRADDKMIQIWIKKLVQLGSNKVWLKRSGVKALSKESVNAKS